MAAPRSAYDPVFGGDDGGAETAEAERAKAAFERASRAYLASPLPWLVWALLLPGAALLTPVAHARARAPGVLLVWSLAILAGGAVEGLALLGARRRAAGGPLGAWAMRAQGNLSLVALALSGALAWAEAPELLPGLWLLLLGHSFFALGGLSLPALRWAGLCYQVGGVAALWPGAPALTIFAAATATGNLWVALGIARRGQATGAGSS